MEKLSEILKHIDNLDVRIKEEVKGLKKHDKKKKEHLSSTQRTNLGNSSSDNQPSANRQTTGLNRQITSLNR